MNTNARAKRMKALRDKGHTLKVIGGVFGVSGERVRQVLHPELFQPRAIWLKASHNNRRTCYICRTPVLGRKFCKRCVVTNKLGVGGRDLTRGIVRGRDNNTCQVCGYKWTGKEKKRLDVHHLEGMCGKLTRSYDKVESLNSMITVCHQCHYNLDDHRQYGKKA